MVKIKNNAAQPIMKKWSAPNSRSTCCSRAELLVPNPTRSSKTSAGFWALLWMFLRLLNSKAPRNALKYSLHQCSRILSLWSRWNYFCKLNPYFWFVGDNLPLFTVTFSCDTRFKFFLPPWRIYRCVTANMKTIKTRSEPNPSVFPFEALEKTSHMTWLSWLSHDLH